MTVDNNDTPSLITTTWSLNWLTTTTTNPTILPVWPWIVFTYRRQSRQIQPYYDHMLFLLTDDNDKPNHNMTIYCVYGRTTTTINPTIISVWPCIVFTDGQQQQTTTYCLQIDDNNDKPNHNTTTYCVYWRRTTTTNPIIIRQYIAVT